MHRRPANFAITLCSVVVLTATGGCAGWAPWRDPKEAAKLAEKYGMNAKQRIADLEKRAKDAKKGDEARQTAFSQELAQSIVSEHDPRVRASIVEIAAGFDVPAASAVCQGALQDPDARVRSAACDAWAAKGGDQAVELISIRCRQETDVDVRLRAIRSLGKLKQKSAIPVLAQSLEDPDPAIQYRAVAALKEVSGRDLGNDVNAWRQWAAADEATRDASWSIAETFRKIF